MRRLAILLTALAGAGVAAPRPDPCAVREQLFLSPAGQAFRGPPGGPAPVALWFAQADADRDGQLDAAEVRADAGRFLATIDRDGDGQIIPDELAAHERATPELSIYAAVPPTRRGKRDAPYGAPIGGALYALTNVPNAVAAADADLNRATTRAELADAAVRIFTGLAKGRTTLALTALPATPQAAMLAACAGRRHR